jgi:hypothetical protein
LLIDETINEIEEVLVFNRPSDIMRDRLVSEVSCYHHAFDICKGMVQIYRCQRNRVTARRRLARNHVAMNRERIRNEIREETREMRDAYELVLEDAVSFVRQYRDNAIYNLRLSRFLDDLYRDWREFLNGDLENAQVFN